jgi:hypothetical protein
MKNVKDELKEGDQIMEKLTLGARRCPATPLPLS